MIVAQHGVIVLNVENNVMLVVLFAVNGCLAAAVKRAQVTSRIGDCVTERPTMPSTSQHPKSLEFDSKRHHISTPAETSHSQQVFSPSHSLGMGLKSAAQNGKVAKASH